MPGSMRKTFDEKSHAGGDLSSCDQVVENDGHTQVNIGAAIQHNEPREFGPGPESRFLAAFFQFFRAEGSIYFRSRVLQQQMAWQARIPGERKYFRQAGYQGYRDRMGTAPPLPWQQNYQQ